LSKLLDGGYGLADGVALLPADGAIAAAIVEAILRASVWLAKQGKWEVQSRTPVHREDQARL